ncbi:MULTISPECIES: UDP-glucose/GDP-mannose dehydrogenase family protein [Streptomyces]|uniref:UDP-glucose 6-dehydrogenase n=1 Tax=Streptomyces sviceus (strain ATCC 29083 / DSM 924 / JCM 4929 / NBRC 13980 / NCIMB 11184 / NRRL 5439 / UC 5370) TaxID=463191 RepID=B5I3Z2_STRX2|nr:MULTISPECIES: UDP-glucose/GDP-mannose dehydrogenase family protein [Streptomyces]EDY59797.1 UDP-glucose 6-dehydrogenase [Streptomyces sviceus ATCC 29083]MYT03879.1 nucleotide sugar dehydrogenase [Streptomyces sp. SID5470]
MRLTVIGTGYLGAVHAACMADIGHDVLGVDTDSGKIAALAAGRAPFFEPGLPEILVRNTRAGRLRFTTSLQEAAEFADVHFVCVGTPQRTDSLAADLRHVEAVVDGLAPLLTRDSLIVGKSTVPVGTTRTLTRRVTSQLRPGVDTEVAWNPEFLREGFAVQDTLHPDRLVVGVTSPHADRTLREVYAPMLRAGVAYVSTDPATAELVKVAANSFLATKISFINAMAEVCDASGADVVTLAEALGHDARIGRAFLSAGLGFGGGCLPKDIRAFLARAEELQVGEAVSFLYQVDRINHRQRRRTVDLARQLLGGEFAGRRVAVLGATFKPDSDDVRDSPALAVAAEIVAQDADVRVHDPEGIDNARAALSGPSYSTDVMEVCRDADLVLHLTEWRQYRALDPVKLLPVVRTPRIADARNALDATAWREAGWHFRALGRPAHVPPPGPGDTVRVTIPQAVGPVCTAPTPGDPLSGAPK